MSEMEDITQDNSIAAMFAELSKFEIKLESGETRMAKIRTATIDERRRAEEYALSVIEEKSKGEPDPLTGRIIKLPTRENMMEYAKEKGMWTNEDDFEYATLEAQLKTNIEQLEQGHMKLSRGYELAIQILQNRKAIQPYNSRRWEIYGLTADAAGEEAMHRYLCVATAVWLQKDGTEGERIFSDIVSYEKAPAWLRNPVLKQYMILIGTANDLVSSLSPELEFFRDYEFLDQEGNIYDVTKKTVVLNLYEKNKQEQPVEILTGFTDESGNVIEKRRHPSFEMTSEITLDSQQVSG